MALDLGTLTGYLELDESKFEGVLSNLPGKLELSGAAMKLVAGGLAIGIGAALAGGITNAIELESANAKITASLGLTEEESARIGGVAGKLYADAYGESVEEVNSAVESVVSSFDGLRNASSEDIQATTAKLLDLQTALGIDVSRAAQVAGQAVKNGLAGDPAEAIDLLVGNLQRVPEALREDLLDAVDEYGPILANMGYSGEEAFGMLAAAADKGMYGIDKTGDALKELSIRATDMSTASVAAYEAAGLNAEEMAAKFAAGGESARGATDELIAALLGMSDPVAQSNAAIALFGTPLEDLGTQEIPTFLDSLAQVKDGFGETAGAAEDMSSTLNDTAAVGWTELSRQWDSIIGQVGSALLPILNAVIDFLLENPAVLQIVAAAVGILAAAFIGLTVATWAMNTALLANPITWIILAIVALIAAVVLLIANWDAVVSFLTDVWNGFVSWFTGVMDGFLAWWGSMWEGFGTWVSDVWNGFIGWIVGIWNGFVAFLMAGGAAISGWWNGLWAGIGAFFQGIWDGIVAWAVGMVSNFIRGWQIIWSGLTSFFSGLWSGISGGITGAWNGILSFFTGIPGSIMGFFSGIGSWLWNAGRDLINGLLNGIKSLAGTIGNFFLGLLPDWIVGPFKAALGIHSPSRVFAGYGRNLVEGLIVGMDAEQSALDRRVNGLVSAQDYSVGSQVASAAFAPQSAAVRDLRVSLEGATLILDVDGRAVMAIIREQIVDASEERRTQLITGTGEVVFS